MINVKNGDVLIDSDDVVRDLYHLLVALNNIGIDFGLIFAAYRSGELARRYPERMIEITGNKEAVCAVYIDGEINFIGGKEDE